LVADKQAEDHQANERDDIESKRPGDPRITNVWRSEKTMQRV
jgi:hypothetical protein